MTICASQVPIQHWPMLASVYMHLRLCLDTTNSYRPDEEPNHQLTHLAVSYAKSLQYPLPRAEGDLRAFCDYLQNLLQEIEEEIQ